MTFINYIKNGTDIEFSTLLWRQNTIKTYKHPNLQSESLYMRAELVVYFKFPVLFVLARRLLFRKQIKEEKCLKFLQSESRNT